MTEVRLWRDQASLDICIAIEEDRAGHRYAAILQDGGGLKFIEIKPGEVAPLVLRIPRPANVWLDNSLNSGLPKPPKDEEDHQDILAALQATRYHLEDLRTVLKNQGALQGAK